MSKVCASLHNLFGNMKHFSFPFETSIIPRNGIYILFEKGEQAHDGERIVRVGTHTGDNQLRSRLQQHFTKEKKDRSIFRKNIGRAILNKAGDPFLEQWNCYLTTCKAKNGYCHLIDMNKQKDIEKQVSEYIQENFSFVVFEVEEKVRRLDIESKIISTVSWCEVCRPSVKWLGLNSPDPRIVKSGLWLVNGLYKEPFWDKDFLEFRKSISKIRRLNNVRIPKETS